MLYLALDSNAHITFVNEQFSKELGFRAKDLEGQHLLDLVPAPARQTAHYNKLRKALKHAEHYAGVMEWENRDGEELWLRIILQPVKNSAGAVQFFSLHGSDLTRTITTPGNTKISYGRCKDPLR